MIRATLDNIARARKHFRDLAGHEAFDAGPQPVIGCPPWFLEEVRESMGVTDPLELVDQIHGCFVLERPDFSEPLFILADGRFVNVVPGWARSIAANSQAQSIAEAAVTEVRIPEPDEGEGVAIPGMDHGIVIPSEQLQGM